MIYHHHCLHHPHPHPHRQHHEQIKQDQEREQGRKGHNERQRTITRGRGSPNHLASRNCRPRASASAAPLPLLSLLLLLLACPVPSLSLVARSFASSGRYAAARSCRTTPRRQSLRTLRVLQAPSSSASQSQPSSSSQLPSSPPSDAAEADARGKLDGNLAGVSAMAPASASASSTLLMERDGLTTRTLIWDEKRGAYRKQATPVSDTDTMIASWARGGREFLQHTFVPDDVSRDYFSFTRWRCTQRFLAATVNVFGTQALLLALGIKSRGLGAAAATTWVLKDALAKVGRIAWAGKMGRRFDADAKRWRFRSSLLYASGNGLEIVTYLFPGSFLLLATLANALKQMSMLTSSATRNTIYRSFAMGENIGDITAKGEAQIAVVDMFGILSGIILTRIVGTSRMSVGLAYVLLTLLDICAIYRENRSVCFTTMNYERVSLLADDFISGGGKLNVEESEPQSVSRRERIFLPSRRSPTTFRTLSDVGISSPSSLASLASAFDGESFLICRTRRRKDLAIVLHTSAGSKDILKSLVTLRYLEEEEKLTAASGKKFTNSSEEEESMLDNVRKALAKATAAMPEFLTQAEECGWYTHKFMFGNIRRKSDWHPLLK